MNIVTRVVLALLCLTLPAGCASHAEFQVQPPGAEAIPEAEPVPATFAGVPIVGDYDENEDLDFVLRADSAGRVYKVHIHEKAGFDNRGLLRQLRGWINEIEDIEPVRVTGSYLAQYRSDEIEYGFMELRHLAFLDTIPGFAHPYSTSASNTLKYTAYSILLFIPVLVITGN